MSQDNREIPVTPVVIKTNTPMMLIQVAWKCPNCGGRAEANIVTTEQSDHVTKNFVAAYSNRRWCTICFRRNSITMLDEVPVSFVPEKTFVRWARGLPEKAAKGERVPKGRETADTVRETVE